MNIVHTQERFIFNEGIFDIVSLANKRGFLVIVVTNQAGIAKGMYTEKDFVALTKWMSKKFQLKGAKINKTYYCPYHENAIIKEYRKKFRQKAFAWNDTKRHAKNLI